MKAGSAPIGWPIVELGSQNGKPFVAYHVNILEQGLSWSPSGALPNFEPARARSFVTSLSWAAEHVLSVGRPPSRDVSRPVGPLLRVNDLDDLEDRGHRLIDLSALLVLGSACLVLIVQTVRRW